MNIFHKKFKKSSKERRSRCEDRPRFSFHGGRWHCYKLGCHGVADDWVSAWVNMCDQLGDVTGKAEVEMSEFIVEFLVGEFRGWTVHGICNWY